MARRGTGRRSQKDLSGPPYLPIRGEPVTEALLSMTCGWPNIMRFWWKNWKTRGPSRPVWNKYRGAVTCRLPTPRPPPGLTICPRLPCAARKPVHGSPRHSDRDLRRGHSGTRGAWTSRKPLLLLRFDGLFLLRFAERRFRGLLFQEPPRTTARTSTGSRPAHIRWNTTPASICSNRASQSA